MATNIGYRPPLSETTPLSSPASQLDEFQALPEQRKIRHVIAEIKHILNPLKEKGTLNDYQDYLKHHLDQLRVHMTEGSKLEGVGRTIKNLIQKLPVLKKKQALPEYYSALLDSGKKAIQTQSMGPSSITHKNWLALFEHLTLSECIHHFNACSQIHGYFLLKEHLYEIAACAEKEGFWQAEKYPKFMLRLIKHVLTIKAPNWFSQQEKETIMQLVNSYLARKPYYLKYLETLLSKNWGLKPQTKCTLERALDNLKALVNQGSEWNQSEAWLFVDIITHLEKRMGETEPNNLFKDICTHLITKSKNHKSAHYLHQLCSTLPPALTSTLTPTCINIVTDYLMTPTLRSKTQKAKLKLFDLLLKLCINNIKNSANPELNPFPPDLEQRDLYDSHNPSGYSPNTWLLIEYYLIPYAQKISGFDLRNFHLQSIKELYLKQNTQGYWDTTSYYSGRDFRFSKHWDKCMNLAWKEPSPALTTAASRLLNNHAIQIHSRRRRTLDLYLEDIAHALKLIPPTIIVQEPIYKELLTLERYLVDKNELARFNAYACRLIEKAKEYAQDPHCNKTLIEELISAINHCPRTEPDTETKLRELGQLISSSST